MNRTNRPLLLLPLLFAARRAAAGDPLADLRAKLQSLKAAAPFAAKIEIRVDGRSDDEGVKSVDETSASVEALHDGEGIRLRWSRAQLEAARRETTRARRDPDAEKRGGLAGLGAEDALNLLDRAPALLGNLEDATLLESRPDTRAGKPATLLVIKPRMALGKKEKHLKSVESVVKLWLDGEGWPLAAEAATRYKGSFLLMSFHLEHAETVAYARAADRLYAASIILDESGSGLGQHGSSRRTMTVTPLNGQDGAGGSAATAPRSGSWMK